MVAQHGLTREEATSLSADLEAAQYFEELVAQGATARTALHWLTTQLLPALRERQLELSDSPVAPSRLLGLLSLLSADQINAKTAREVLLQMFDSDEPAAAIVERQGFAQVSDRDELASLIEKVLAEQPGAVADVRSGQTKALGFLVGQVM